MPALKVNVAVVARSIGPCNDELEVGEVVKVIAGALGKLGVASLCGGDYINFALGLWENNSFCSSTRSAFARGKGGRIL